MEMKIYQFDKIAVCASFLDMGLLDWLGLNTIDINPKATVYF